VLEGKSMMGYNADYVSASKQDPNKYPQTIGTFNLSLLLHTLDDCYDQ
jgi:hypothetical protein